MKQTEEKQRLRVAIRAQRLALPSDYTTQADASIAERLLSAPEFEAAETVFCFVGVGLEINTRPILEQLLSTPKTLCVPLCTGPGRMEARVIRSLSELAPGAFGLLEPPANSPRLEPDEIDFAVLPCLTCNRSGARLGNGGGYYDRFLAAYRGGTVLLCRERLLHQEIPLEPHDYPVPWVLTERGLYEDGVPARLR